MRYCTDMKVYAFDYVLKHVKRYVDNKAYIRDGLLYYRIGRSVRSTYKGTHKTLSLEECKRIMGDLTNAYV